MSLWTAWILFQRLRQFRDRFIDLVLCEQAEAELFLGQPMAGVALEYPGHGTLGCAKSPLLELSPG